MKAYRYLGSDLLRFFPSLNRLKVTSHSISTDVYYKKDEQKLFLLKVDLALRLLQLISFFLLGSSSGAESDTSILQSDDETEVTAGGLSRTPDLRVCPLRSLVNYEENSYSPIQPDQEPDSGPVDPVFVDEESSGEAVANAGKHNNN